MSSADAEHSMDNNALYDSIQAGELARNEAQNSKAEFLAKQAEANQLLKEITGTVAVPFFDQGLGTFKDYVHKGIRMVTKRAGTELRRQANKVVTDLADKYGVDLADAKKLVTGDPETMNALRTKLGDKFTDFQTEMRDRLRKVVTDAQKKAEDGRKEVERLAQEGKDKASKALDEKLSKVKPENNPAQEAIDNARAKAEEEAEKLRQLRAKNPEPKPADALNKKSIGEDDPLKQPTEDVPFEPAQAGMSPEDFEAQSDEARLRSLSDRFLGRSVNRMEDQMGLYNNMRLDERLDPDMRASADRDWKSLADQVIKYKNEMERRGKAGLPGGSEEPYYSDNPDTQGLSLFKKNTAEMIDEDPFARPKQLGGSFKAPQVPEPSDEEVQAKLAQERQAEAEKGDLSQAEATKKPIDVENPAYDPNQEFDEEAKVQTGETEPDKAPDGPEPKPPTPTPTDEPVVADTAGDASKLGDLGDVSKALSTAAEIDEAGGGPEDIAADILSLAVGAGLVAGGEEGAKHDKPPPVPLTNPGTVFGI